MADHDPIASRRIVGLGVLGYVLLSPLLARSTVVVCPFRRLTHHACPFCGLTRSVAALLRGNLRESVAWHPLGWAVAAAAVDLSLRPGRIRRIAPMEGM